MLALKFMSGNSRINHSHNYTIRVIRHGQDSFPVGHTCDSTMDIPLYSSKELMEQRILTAIRLCGEIDQDGDDHNYGQENNDSESVESHDENQDSD